MGRLGAGNTFLWIFIKFMLIKTHISRCTDFVRCDHGNDVASELAFKVNTSWARFAEVTRALSHSGYSNPSGTSPGDGEWRWGHVCPSVNSQTSDGKGRSCANPSEGGSARPLSPDKFCPAELRGLSGSSVLIKVTFIFLLTNFSFRFMGES